MQVSSLNFKTKTLTGQSRHIDCIPSEELRRMVKEKHHYSPEEIRAMQESLARREGQAKVYSQESNTTVTTKHIQDSKMKPEDIAHYGHRDSYNRHSGEYTPGVDMYRYKGDPREQMLKEREQILAKRNRSVLEGFFSE